MISFTHSISPRAENKAWTMKLKAEGYTVIDLGNPYPAKNGFSPFYAMEKRNIFYEGK